MCDGATDEERLEWELLPASEFKYLNKSSSYNLAGVDNAEEYRVWAVPSSTSMLLTATEICTFLCMSSGHLMQAQRCRVWNGSLVRDQ